MPNVMETKALERPNRKLAAIFSADAKGYSRLMGDDELLTITTIETYREVISEVITRFCGRVIDSPGDNILAAFDSAADIVEASIEIQKRLALRNAELAGDRRMLFRIGINFSEFPGYSLEWDKRFGVYKDKAQLERQHDDLRKAGIT